MTDLRKITVNLPARLIDLAVESSGKGLTETLRDALKEYNHREACRRLLALKGKVQFQATWQELRGKDDKD